MNRQAPKVSVSLRLSTDLVDSFQRIADAVDRDRTWVMARALRMYLESEGGDLLKEAEGLAQLARGEAYDFDEVMKEGEAIIREAEAKLAARKAS